MLVNNYNIPITKINLSDLEKEEVIKTLNSGWIVQGQKVAEFEKEFSKFVNVNYSVAVSSCTTALHLALLLLDVKEGDEVIVPSFTFVATANVVEYVKAKPVFVDIDIKTFNISIDSILSIIESKKYKRLKVLMPVNLFGLCAPLDKILKIAKEYNLKVIEDSACGFASYINGKHSGTFGDIGCFSFHPRKIITTGEGGMLITNDEDIYKRAQKLRNHGAIINDLKRHNLNSFYLSDYDEVGYNYRMTDLQASLGLIQLRRAQEILDKRYRIVKKYYNDLSDEEKILLPYVPDNYIHYFNFLLNGDFRYGKSVEEVIKYYKDIIPEALSVRSHSMTQSSFILDKFEKYGLLYDCNTFFPYSSGIKNKPYKYWTKNLIKVPYFWEDDIHMIYKWDWDVRLFISYEGIKVFDFHPIHIFLNCESMNRYNEAKKNNFLNLEKYKYKGYGIYNFFIDLIDLIRGH